MYYPKHLFSIREDLTRENLRRYDEQKKKFYAKCEEIDSEFWHRNLRERMKIKEEVAEILGYTI
jgi:hypothetical protein